MFSPAELEKKLSELIDVHGVPGAQLSVLDGDQLTEVAAGVLSQRTGCPSRADALFLPGSIGKLYTATLVMMLVEEGKLDLDIPIRHYLPDFEVRDPHARDTVTARQLLSHTSGFDGDHFTDTGRGDDALARYVAGCSDLPQIVDPGQDLELQQQRLRHPRPGRRGAQRHHVRRGAARAAVRPARTRLDGLVRGRGDRAPRRGRPRPRSRGPLATGRHPGVGPAPRVRPDGQRRGGERGRRHAVRRPPPVGRARPRRVAAARRRPGGRDAGPADRARRRHHHRRGLGPRLDPRPLGRRRTSSATTATPSGRTPSCASRRPSSSGSASRRTSRAP